MSDIGARMDAAQTSARGVPLGNIRGQTSSPQLSILLIIAALIFNPALAIVNAHIHALTPSVVIACELVIVGTAHVLALRHYRPEMRPWYYLMAIICAFGAVRMVATGEFQPKFIRDLILIPTFVVLGMISNARHAVATLLGLIFVVDVGIALEGLCLDCYSGLFSIKDYYLNTRGMSDAEFTTQGVDLYISATRPDERYFPFFDLHRMSSVFLEPVSLGNFALIAVALSAAMWRLMTVFQRAFTVASIVVMLFACDGRLSGLSSIVIVAAIVMHKVLPRYAALTFLPLVVIAVMGATSSFDLATGTDDLRGRVAQTGHLLQDMRLVDIMGLSNRLVDLAADSGVVYLMVTHSVVILIMVWSLVVVFPDAGDTAQQKYRNAVCIYLALAMIVSWSFLSIKTAAPMWFFYGVLTGLRGDASPSTRSADRSDSVTIKSPATA